MIYNNDSYILILIFACAYRLFCSLLQSRAIYKAVEKSQKALTNINGSYTPIINIFCTYQLAASFYLFPQLISYLAASKGLLGSLISGSSRTSKTISISSHPTLLLWKISHKLLPFIITNIRSLFNTATTLGFNHIKSIAFNAQNSYAKIYF